MRCSSLALYAMNKVLEDVMKMNASTSLNVLAAVDTAQPCLRRIQLHTVHTSSSLQWYKLG